MRHKKRTYKPSSKNIVSGYDVNVIGNGAKIFSPPSPKKTQSSSEKRYETKMLVNVVFPISTRVDI
jgi:hypothetical protein